MSDYLGNIFIVAAPSGGGKTSLVNHLLHAFEDITVSISHTTRNQRIGEQDGVNYHFVDEEKFLSMVAASEFIEHAKVYDHYYGTAAASIQKSLQEGIDVLLDIDWQGAQQIRQHFPKAISIFLLPPSLSTLKKRLLMRGRENPELVHERMLKAQAEISHYAEFDYMVINDDFKHAAEDLESIVRSTRLNMKQQSAKHCQLLSFLLTEDYNT